MEEFNRALVESRRLIELTLPIMAAQVSGLAMGIVDMMLLGRISALHMSAAGLGCSVLIVVFAFSSGVASGVQPLVAMAMGRERPERARAWLVQGLILSAILAIPAAVAVLIWTTFFQALEVPEPLARQASYYVFARIPGIPFACVGYTMRAYLSGVGRTRSISVAALKGNIANALLAYLLIFGAWGLPGLGAIGAGLATSIAQMFMALIMWRATQSHIKEVKREDPLLASNVPRPRELLKIIRIGFPMALQHSVELGVLTFVATMIARLGDAELAGHNIALEVTGLTSILASSLGNAISTRVGFHLGRGDAHAMRQSGFTGIVIGGLGACLCGLIYANLSSEIAGQFAPADLGARDAGQRFISIASVFVVFEGIQIACGSALMGIGETKWIFIAHTLVCWAFSMPLAFYLDRDLGFGGGAYWWSLAFGLAAISIFLAMRFGTISRRPLSELEAGASQ